MCKATAGQNVRWSTAMKGCILPQSYRIYSIKLYRTLYGKLRFLGIQQYPNVFHAHFWTLCCKTRTRVISKMYGSSPELMLTSQQASCNQLCWGIWSMFLTLLPVFFILIYTFYIPFICRWIWKQHFFFQNKRNHSIYKSVYISSLSYYIIGHICMNFKLIITYFVPQVKLVKFYIFFKSDSKLVTNLHFLTKSSWPVSSHVCHIHWWLKFNSFIDILQMLPVMALGFHLIHLTFELQLCSLVLLFIQN